jgi:hypothetical protein
MERIDRAQIERAALGSQGLAISARELRNDEKMLFINMNEAKYLFVWSPVLA